ncbi:MAG TPA: TlpA disulfide reductase family protein [Pyrinomonadaceae bacterium]|nr:TlpA disulfide reductase family protein [Pyrinomonadaceae bacterium]
MTTKRIFITLALALVALCNFPTAAQVTTATQEAATQATATREEARVPSVRLKALDGKTYDTSEMRGEVVVVSFGATWCVPCVWELKAIEELKEEYAGKPVRFLWVSIEEKERTTDRVLRHYAKSNRLTIPVLRDEDKSAFLQFTETTRIPLVVFFDREGRFDAPAHRGMSSDITAYKRLVRARIDPLLIEKTATPAQEGQSSRR